MSNRNNNIRRRRGVLLPHLIVPPHLLHEIHADIPRAIQLPNLLKLIPLTQPPQLPRPRYLNFPEHPILQVHKPQVLVHLVLLPVRHMRNCRQDIIKEEVEALAVEHTAELFSELGFLGLYFGDWFCWFFLGIFLLFSFFLLFRGALKNAFFFLTCFFLSLPLLHLLPQPNNRQIHIRDNHIEVILPILKGQIQ